MLYFVHSLISSCKEIIIKETLQETNKLFVMPACILGLGRCTFLDFWNKACGFQHSSSWCLSVCMLRMVKSPLIVIDACKMWDAALYSQKYCYLFWFWQFITRRTETEGFCYFSKSHITWCRISTCSLTSYDPAQMIFYSQKMISSNFPTIHVQWGR